MGGYFEDKSKLKRRLYSFLILVYSKINRSQWPRGLRRRSTVARLLRSWVRIPSGAWVSVCCDCCVLSGRSLCDELITRPEEYYLLWCVVMCDLKKSKSSCIDPLGVYRATKKKSLELLTSMAHSFKNIKL